jgi:RNA polymerase sigma-70 factor (ECF subfamily)
MEPAATSAFAPAQVANAELEDFDRVVQFYWPRILRFVLASVRDLDVAETLTQDCFWNAYKARKSFRGDSTLHTWLMRIAVNSVRKFARNRRLQFWKQIRNSDTDWSSLAEVMPGHTLSPEERTLIDERLRAVWMASSQLSERQRTVFLLRFMEDMNPSEIALATGLTESAVNVHLFRAVRAIRNQIGTTL